MFTIITTTITKEKQKMLNLILQNISFSEVALKKMKVGFLPRSNFKCVFFE